MIGIDKIKPNPYQARLSFDEKKLNNLAKSIKAGGLKKPIELRKEKDGTFTLKDGERRLRAMKILGWKTLEQGKHFVFVKSTDKQLMVDTLIEFCMRENLKPVERGRALLNLMSTLDIKDINVACNVINRATDWKDNGILSKPSSRNYFIPKETVLKVAEYLDMLGIGRTNANALLKILNLPKDIQKVIIYAPPNVKMQFETRVSKRGRKGQKKIKLPDKRLEFISLRHAEQLARVKDERVIRFLFNKIVRDGWGVVHLTKVVDDFINSRLSGEDYFQYYASKKKKCYDLSLAALIRSMDNFSSTLASYRTINLVKMATDFKKKEFIISGIGLRSNTIGLKQALDQVLLDAKQLIKEKDKEVKALKEMPFTIMIQKSSRNNEPLRFNFPKEIAENLGLKANDRITLKVVSVRK